MPKDAADLYALCDETIDRYSTRDDDLDILDDYYYLEGDKEQQTTPEEEGIEEVNMPHAPNIISLVQDLLANAEMTISVPAKADKPSEKKLSDAAEVFLGAILQQSQRAQQADFLSQMAWTVAMKNCLAGRVMVMDSWIQKDEAAEDDRRSVAADKVPILVQLRDPRTVYPEFGIDGLAYVVEEWDRTVQDIRITYGEEMLEGKKPADEVKWREYWDDKEFCYWADQKVVKQSIHTYGGIPWAFEFARQTMDPDPEKRSRPLLLSMLDVIDRLDRIDSMEHTFVHSYIGTAWLVKTDDDSEFQLDLSPNKKNYLKPNEEVVPLQGGRKPIELDQARARLDMMLERGTFPGSLWGQDPGRVMAGYAINLLNQSGQARLNPMVACVERFVASMMSNVLMVAENYVQPLVGGPIPYHTYDKATDGGKVYTIRAEQTFDPKNLDGFYHVDVSLGEILPADEQANMGLANMGRTPGVDGRPLLSDETLYAKYNLVANPAEEQERISLQMARTHPAVQQVLQTAGAIRTIKSMEKDLKKLGIEVEPILEALRAEVQPPEPEPEPEPEVGPTAAEMLEMGMQGPGPEPGLPAPMVPGMEGLTPEDLAALEMMAQGGPVPGAPGPMMPGEEELMMPMMGSPMMPGA